MTGADADRAVSRAAGDARWWAVLALSISVLAVGIDLTVLNLALPTLAGSLDASTGDLQWFVDAYSLVLAAALLPAGMLGDRYGRKKLLVGALLLFGASSVACAYASSAELLIAARAALGLGAAGIIPLSLSVLAVLFPENHERRKAITVITAATLLGYPLGPVLGGWLLTHAWWGSVFLVNVPVVLVAVAGVTSVVPESRAHRRRRLDMTGIVASSLGLVGVTYGLIDAGHTGWDQPGPIVALSGGIVLLVGFVLYERRLARHPDRAPLLDPELFGSPSFSWGTLMATIATFVILGLLFVLPQYFQEVMGASPLGTGMRLLPVIGGLIFGALLAGRVQRETPGARLRAGANVIVATGLALLGVSALIGLNTTTTSGTAFAALWSALGGIGLGFALPTAMNVALGAVTEDRSGAGSSVIWVCRQAGGTLGVAILGTILHSAYTGEVHGSGLSSASRSEIRESVTAGVDVAGELGRPELLLAVRSAFVDAMDQVLLVCAVIALASAVLAVRGPRWLEAAGGSAGTPRGECADSDEWIARSRIVG